MTSLMAHPRPPAARLRAAARSGAVAGRDLGLAAFDLLLRLRPGVPPHETDGARDVLIIRMDALGDFVLWLDAARALRQIYAGRRVVLWCDGSVADLARQVGLFDEVVGVSPRRFRTDLKYRAALLARLRAGRAAEVLHPVYSREGDFADGESLVRAARGAAKIGFAVPRQERGWRTRLSDRCYTRLIPTPVGVRMELRRNADFVRGLGRPDFAADVPTLDADPADAAAEDYFVLFPGAGLAQRCWPAENFAEVARRIHARTGWQGILCGGGAEKPLGDRIAAALPSALTNRAGETSLAQYVALLAGARLVVSNDTSAAHISAAVGTPAVVVVGGGEPGRFYPYDVEVPARRTVPLAVRRPMPCDGCGWSCVHPVRADEPFPCVGGVTVEQVWAGICGVLERSADPLEVGVHGEGR